MITNKIEAIKKVRAFCEQEFGTIATLSHSKELVEGIMYAEQVMVKARLFEALVNLIQFYPDNATGMRDKVKDLFREATGYNLY